MLLVVVYLAVTWIRTTPVRLSRLEYRCRRRGSRSRRSRSRRATGSLPAASSTLLPPERSPLLTFLGAFLVAQLLGLASHVPGGVGVFEGLMILLLQALRRVRRAAAVARRVSRDLLPPAVRRRARRPRRRRGLAAPGAGRARGRGVRLADGGADTTRAGDFHVPRGHRAAVLRGDARGGRSPGACSTVSFPLGIIEASHFLGSIAGAALLLLSQGLARRLDGA